jgi:RNA polymerase sigma factor (sigma-70 family)
MNGGHPGESLLREAGVVDNRSSMVIEAVENLLRTQRFDARPDGDLLRRFIVERDEAAFSLLVRRHGPMILGVCRRILRDANDAEDAFQATFLVLVRRARSLTSRAVLGDWLHGVARRTALNALRAAAQRRAKEQSMARTESIAEKAANDLLPILDEELARLPEKYRLPIVLCELEGQPRRQAAERLGWPEGTVAGRLARARQLLAKRLTQRGVTLSTGAIAAALAPGAAQASVPAEILSVTVKTAIEVAAGRAVSSVKVAALADGTMKTLFLTKLKNVVAVVFVFIAMGIGVGVVASRQILPGQGTQNEHGPASNQGTPEMEKTTSRPRVYYTLRKLEVVRQTISVSLYGTTSIVEDIPLARNVEVFFHGAPSAFLTEGKLSDLGVADTPLTLDFASDGKTVKRITAYLALAPCILTDVDPEAGTIDGISLMHGIRPGLRLRRDAEIRIDGKRSSISELRKGMIVDPYEDPSPTAVLPDDGVRTTIPQLNFKGFMPFAKIEACRPIVAGTINGVETDKNTLSLTPAGTNLRLNDLPLSADATIVINGKEGRLADIQPGTQVVAELRGDDSAPRTRAIVSLTAHIQRKGEDFSPTTEKRGRVPDPPPALQAEFARWDSQYRHGSEEKFRQLESEAAELSKKYPDRDDRARIEFQVAFIAGQSGIDKHVERVRKYALKALASSRDPIERGRIYSLLGSAGEIDAAAKTFEERRRSAAGPLLAGYAEMLAQGLPDRAPALPRVDRIGDVDPVDADVLAKHAAQLEARREAEFVVALVHRRDTLANQLRWLYRPHLKVHGRNAEGPDELRVLATKALKDPAAVSKLLAWVTGPDRAGDESDDAGRKSSVTEIRGDLIQVSLGSRQGSKVGDILEVHRPNPQRLRVGILRVVAVGDDDAVTQLVERTDQAVQVGDLVTLRSPGKSR